MIDAAMGHIVAQLNQHFRHRFALTEDVAVVSNLQDAGGAQIISTDNKLVVFLSGIERDTIAHRPQGTGGALGGLRMVEPVFLNLLVMCAANFNGSNYPESLKFLSSTIAFFQSKSVLDRHNSPELDARIERLVLNIENLSFSEMNSLWSIHGGRYIPSILYRVRMISLDDRAVIGRDPSVRDINVGVSA